ncbi:MAG TPA: non-homologous end-joining DNA ligase [Planosporangium sp.]|jgi:bifunctional non-homologous end joining protein LigD|nr:non-homologous end-joining DNA ligase [Planosporangium sp.]
MADKLAPYRSKRSASRTPEPVPAPGPLPGGGGDTFVIQEHHARRLHWDFRLERDGVLVSWALPKGLPLDPKKNHLAVHTEDHPLDYAAFEGEIPKGEYGGGVVEIWDRGTYECEKWTDREVKVVLHGERARGRYVLIRTRGDNWIIHRMDPPPAQPPERASAPEPAPASGREPGPEPMPELIRPMLATLGELPAPGEDADFGYEMKWDGLRAIVYVANGQVRVMTRNDKDVTVAYPELCDLGGALGDVPAVLDGEIVARDPAGRISFMALQPRIHQRDPARIRRLREQTPVTYQVFDLLYLDGHNTIGLRYEQRRELLESLRLHGPHWDTPPYARGGGARALAESKERRLEGIVAKRLDSIYEPGRRSSAWVKVKHTRTQEVIIGGWTPGQGRRAGTIGALLLGIPGPEGLEYVGQVGTGFNREALDDLYRRLRPLERKTPPFARPLPARDAKDAHWVTPKLVGEVEFGEWTRDGRLRQPSWRGLRPDKSPDEVVRES